MLIGYARVSTPEQNLERQIDQLKEYGCEKIFSDKVSGNKKELPEYNKMLEQLRPGDSIILDEFSRVSRNVKTLIEFAEFCEANSITFKSLREPWGDTTTDSGKFIFTIFAGLCEFERNRIVARTNAGLKSARARGRFGGRPRKSPDKIKMALTLYDSNNVTIAEITKLTGVSKTSLFKYVKERVHDKK
ncbi:MAG: recombinase family protein [Nanoarchaeota archaeon]|nr:recombinase family protein [Nanoarchaeota archaeon]